MRELLISRLDSKIATSPACWEWLAYVNADGYGRVGVGSKVRPAHRVVYELAVGPIPAGLHLDHLCSNRSCVNPDHLEPVTQAENIRRGKTGIFNSSKSHCRNGHPYSGDNLYVKPNGERCCRTCTRAAKLRYRSKSVA